MKHGWMGLGAAFLMAASPESADAMQRTCTGAEKAARPELHVAIDAATDTILAGDGAHERFFQASLTKRMTLLLAMDAMRDGRLHPDRIIALPHRSYRFRNEHGETQDMDPVHFEFASIGVRDAIMATNLRSSNRAPLALALAIGGTEENFVRMMNEKAAAMGLVDTHFVNATGYPTRDALGAHYTSPFDHAKIVQRLYRDYPEEMARLRATRAELTGYKENGRSENFTLKATLKLMPGTGSDFSLANVEGGKTGTACKAKALDVEARIDGRLVIAVVSGNDRDRDAHRLLARPDADFRRGLEMAAQIEARPPVLFAFQTAPSPFIVWPTPSTPFPPPPLLGATPLFNRLSFDSGNEGGICRVTPQTPYSPFRAVSSFFPASQDTGLLDRNSFRQSYFGNYFATERRYGL
jgi:D-alanyl-D-alanine carboxypeptidase